MGAEDGVVRRLVGDLSGETVVRSDERASTVEVVCDATELFGAWYFLVVSILELGSGIIRVVSRSTSRKTLTPYSYWSL